MKKIIWIPVAFCLIVTGLFAACAGARPPTSYEAHIKMLESLEGAGSIEARANHVIEATYGEETILFHIESDIKQIVRSEADMEMEMRQDVQYDYADEQNADIQFQVVTYYRDGCLYQNYIDFDYTSKIAIPIEAIQGQLLGIQLAFGEDAVLTSSTENTPEGQKLIFDLSPDAMRGSMEKIALAAMLNLDSSIPMDDLDDIGLSFGQVRYESVVDSGYMPKSCILEYEVEATLGGETVQLSCATTISDIRRDTVTEIEFPDTLDEYYDASTAAGGAGDTESEDYKALLEETLADLEGYYSAIESDYTVENPFGESSYAALFLEDSGEYLDYYLWLIYQTQAGVSAPAQPTGFSSGAELSAEGLVRFFCFVNTFQLDAFADRNEELYYIADELLPSSLDHFFQGYTYDPGTLPSEFSYQSGMLRLPFALCKPAANPCRVDQVQVVDQQRVKIVATGLDTDKETPINTQELVLLVQGEGGVVFESYAIKPL